MTGRTHVVEVYKELLVSYGRVQVGVGKVL